MAPEQKTEAFLIRLGRTEDKMLRELSDQTGLTRADVVRQLIRREHAATIGQAPSKPKPKRK